MLLFVAAFAAACTNEIEEFAKDSFENVPENASLTRSCLSDTIDLGELVSLDDLDGDWILDDYGIRSWVESLPTKSISMATLANSYRIIGL